MLKNCLCYKKLAPKMPKMIGVEFNTNAEHWCRGLNTNNIQTYVYGFAPLLPSNGPLVLTLLDFAWAVMAKVWCFLSYLPVPEGTQHHSTLHCHPICWGNIEMFHLCQRLRKYFWLPKLGVHLFSYPLPYSPSPLPYSPQM